MEFWTKHEDFWSYIHLQLCGADGLVYKAITAFQNGELISAGNKFLDVYEAAQNAQQEALSNFTEISEYKIDPLRKWQCYLIHDAALCFYLANSNDVARKKEIYSAWPKTRSKVRYRGDEYEQGMGVGNIMKDSITPLDAALSGCTSTRELAKRLSQLCRFLSNGPYLATTECILALMSCPTPPKILTRQLKYALELAERAEDTSASKWIKDCINKIQN
jgi:hypothetical protein